MSDFGLESVESFRLRARSWLNENMPPIQLQRRDVDLDDDTAEWERARELQRKLYDGGFAGIAFPKEYGGLGLTPAHQAAFTEETDGYEMPLKLNTPSLTICAATILDMGSEQQKRERISAAIRGDEILAQFLSEPRGGSDLAGVTTRADRDGDTWILNGAKTWSSSAYAADWALCLARTDWDAPKHRGLTMFLVPTKAPGITMRRIRQVNGSNEFCEEFFDDVVLPADAVVGEVNNGWSVASRQLFHEKVAVGGGSPYASGKGLGDSLQGPGSPVAIAQRLGRTGEPAVREIIGEWHARKLVSNSLIGRISEALKSEMMPAPASSFMRLFTAEFDWFTYDVSLQVSGGYGAIAPQDDDGLLARAAVGYLSRQGGSLGGGSTEMARNIISERVLGMPREFAADRDVPFNQVPQGAR
ncbi:acyl-CoA dehydrogenase [Rhodococcus ruber BKS 20-38]|uniref:Acyl-CoA dehydrogenase n=1 Tax=Rhodococcus ruber BKS 20-38 TaxID=1278076 RepID=M3A356_9NOCA|nr:acyl-CoA dehydrogenase family protein [Rhodococcus ruber]EME67328.1 acyl-CoA dehydrogenase [Rhodococcus ruber BKS 20-38]